MEWTNIEKKWHEMARRLQNATGLAAKEKSGPAPDSARTPPPADMTGIGDLDTRATA